MSNENNNMPIGDHPVWNQWDRLGSGLYVVATGCSWTIFHSKFFIKIFEPKEGSGKGIYLEPEGSFSHQRERNSFLRETETIEDIYAEKNGQMMYPGRAELITFSPRSFKPGSVEMPSSPRLEHIIYGQLNSVFDWDKEYLFNVSEKRVYNDLIPVGEPITRTLDNLAYTLQRAKPAK